MYFFWQNNQKEGGKRAVGPGMRKKEVGIFLFFFGLFLNCLNYFF